MKDLDLRVDLSVALYRASGERVEEEPIVGSRGHAIAEIRFTGSGRAPLIELSPPQLLDYLVKHMAPDREILEQQLVPIINAARAELGLAALSEEPT